MTCSVVACGDDNDEPDNSGDTGSSTENVLTIDGSKWSDPKIRVYDDSYGDYYFTYMAFDSKNGTRNFDFHANASCFGSPQENIAEEIEIDALGEIGNVVLYEMETQYISGKVSVERVGQDFLVLNFKNYECYYYPENASPASEYKHKINGKVRFNLDGE